METPSPAVLTLTIDAVQQMVRMCRHHLPTETCGFIVAPREDGGSPSVGSRVVWMQNVHPKPERHYKMDDRAVLMTYKEFDLLQEDPVAIFHCHTDSEPIMSDEDLANAADPTLAYLIVSLADPKPKIRAYGVRHFIGNNEATQIPIVIHDPPAHSPATAPAGAWALSPGNQVRIVYARQGVSRHSTTVAVVVELTDEVVSLDPQHKTAARSIPLERIVSVHVLKESDLAVRIRSDLKQRLQQASILLDWPDVKAMPDLARVLNLTFPSTMLVSLEGR